MSYQVASERLPFKVGAVVGADDLQGCNIEALVRGGHLVPVSTKREPVGPAVEPKTTKRSPVVPVPNDTADEPEEQD
jgi:hypothetical protein